MKKIAVIFLMATCMLPAFAQTFSYEYTYDASGNRTGRSVLLLKSTGGNSLLDDSGNPISKDLNDLENLKDEISNLKITLYPNPTRGELVVQILPFSDEISGRISIFNLAGNLIFEKTQLGEFVSVDLENQPKGEYILKLIVGTSEKTYKIIKQ